MTHKGSKVKVRLMVGQFGAPASPIRARVERALEELERERAIFCCPLVQNRILTARGFSGLRMAGKCNELGLLSRVAPSRSKKHSPATSVSR